MGVQLHHPNGAARLIVRESIGQDVRDLAPILRIADKAEIAASTGETPVVALGRGFADSTPCYTATFDGVPAAMFGVVPQPDQGALKVGSVWMLGSDAIPLFKKSFLHQSKPWLEKVCEGYNLAGNVVDARNISHIRWLKWLGFKFVERHDHYGALGLPFFSFIKVV